jgi:N-acetylglucosaminyldiphosphoundecaprenol N-acetyl-beta-D-mannosaminyltransferase
MYRPAVRRSRPIDFMGIPVDNVDSSEILKYIGECIVDGTRAMVLNINVHAVNLAFRQGWLKQMLQDSPLVFCDGDGIRAGCRWLGLPRPPKVTYRVFLWEIAAWCEATGASLYLLGGAPGIPGKVSENLLSRHPALRLAGYHDGFFEKSGPANEQVIEGINAARADVLVVCFGMPLQEQWLFENGTKLAVHACLTGGAAFDYAAGAVSVAPSFMLNHSMEWLYRLWLEPRRMFGRYAFGNGLFMVRLLLWKMGLWRG